MNELREEGFGTGEIMRVLGINRSAVYQDLDWIKEERRRGIGRDWLVNNFVSMLHRLEQHAIWAHGMSERAPKHKDKVEYRRLAVQADSEASRRVSELVRADAAAKLLNNLGKNADEDQPKNVADAFTLAYQKRLADMAEAATNGTNGHDITTEAILIPPNGHS